MYLKCLETIGYHEYTSDNDIKRRKKELMIQLHPDITNENDKTKFLTCLPAFNSIKVYRRNFALNKMNIILILLNIIKS